MDFLQRKFAFKYFFEIKKNLSIREFTKNNCLSLKKIMSKYVKQKITIKLPNDLLVEGKKLSGILQEKIYYNDKKFIIIGIGINIIRNPFIKNYPTTNLFELTGKKISKSNIFIKVSDDNTHFEATKFSDYNGIEDPYEINHKTDIIKLSILYM